MSIVECLFELCI